MSGLVNTITSPFGVKLFKGGPYPDNGALDKQAQQMSGMTNLGNEFLGQAAGLPSLSQMGYLQYMPEVFSQLSALTGAQNPLDPNSGVQDPYSLNPLQQGNLNAENSQSSTNMNNIMQRIKANLAARGLTHSSHMDAAQAYLHNELLKQQNQNNVAARQNAFQNRLDTTGQFGNMLSNIYGQQNQRQGQLVGQAQSLIAPQLQNTAMQGQMAMQNKQNAQSGFGGLLGAYLGGAFRTPKPISVPMGGNPSISGAYGGILGGPVGGIRPLGY